jgi:hypothetical protein
MCLTSKYVPVFRDCVLSNTVVVAPFSWVSEETVLSRASLPLPRDGIEFKIWFHFSNTLKTLVICSQLVSLGAVILFCASLSLIIAVAAFSTHFLVAP